MTPRIEKLHRTIAGKEHHVHRRDLDLELAGGFAAEHTPPMRRMARRLAAVMAEERPVFLEGERIALLRTVRRLPALFTDAEWNGIRSRHTLHELGFVCNISPNYGETIACGLAARRAQAASRLADCRVSGDAEGVLFLEVVISGVDAALDLAERYRLEAERQGRAELAALLARVPRLGATTFHEALQALRFLHFTLWIEGEYHNTLGRLDQVLYPYLQADLAAGRLDLAEAFDLVEEFFLSFNRDSDLYPVSSRGTTARAWSSAAPRRTGATPSTRSPSSASAPARS